MLFGCDINFSNIFFQILFTLFGLIKSSIKGHFGITLPRILLIFVAWGSAQVNQ
jgi:hypothetical protein